jgi:EAL domain-containing protein (putative c-di-GMP-specific phosphodiesterase class I)
VNLSAKSVTDPDMPNHIADELAARGADGSGLCFEVTETAAVVNIDRARRFAELIGELGCEFALDDFGAGFASFYYLKHLAFDLLKIDGEFVTDLTTSPTNQLVVKAVVDIARGLGKRTIAEFVEDAETLEMLRGMGVDFAQGFYVAKPAPLPLRHAPFPHLENA